MLSCWNGGRLCYQDIKDQLLHQNQMIELEDPDQTESDGNLKTCSSFLEIFGYLIYKYFDYNIWILYSLCTTSVCIYRKCQCFSYLISFFLIYSKMSTYISKYYYFFNQNRGETYMLSNPTHLHFNSKRMTSHTWNISACDGVLWNVMLRDVASVLQTHHTCQWFPHLIYHSKHKVKRSNARLRVLFFLFFFLICNCTITKDATLNLVVKVVIKGAGTCLNEQLQR